MGRSAAIPASSILRRSLVRGQEAALGSEEQLTRQVEGAGDVAAAWASAAGARVLACVAGVDQLQVGLA